MLTLVSRGMRERLLADPNFIVKVGIEVSCSLVVFLLHCRLFSALLRLTLTAPQVGIGLFTKSTAEYTKRQDNFMKEIDFVAANVIMALVADFCLVFLPAPTLSFAYGPYSGCLPFPFAASSLTHVFCFQPDPCVLRWLQHFQCHPPTILNAMAA